MSKSVIQSKRGQVPVSFNNALQDHVRKRRVSTPERSTIQYPHLSYPLLKIGLHYPPLLELSVL